MTGIDLMKQRGEFAVTGIIKNINGEANKVYPSGWVGSNATITLDVNGRTQKVNVFGGVGKSEFQIRVLMRGADGKAVKGADGKAIVQYINVDDYNPETFMYFDEKSVIEWGERDSTGRAQRIDHFSELTDGRFANRLLEKKEELIGKRVMIRGDVSFRPTQNYDKIQTDLTVKQITYLRPIEEGSEVVDKFVLNTPVVLNKETLDSINDGVIKGYVPVYHKYLQPKMVNGKEQKGRTVYAQMDFLVKPNGFMAIDETLGFDIPSRKIMLENKINIVSEGTPFVVAKVCLSNKSGSVARDIKIEELLDDPVYGVIAKNSIENNNVENFLTMYKKQNPATVRSEYRQEVDFITILQYTEENQAARDCVFGIDPNAIEFYTLDKLRDEDEAIKLNKPMPQQSAPTQTATINTPKRETNPLPPQPTVDVNQEGFNPDEFPF